MNFDSDRSEDDMFRNEVRSTLRAKLQELFPQGAHSPSREDIQKWTRALNAYDWVTPHWPIDWGGAKLSESRRSILAAELIDLECPAFDIIGTRFVAPVIYTFGTLEQRRRYLPRIRNAEDFWCQGFSEPDAGSDVMGLRTKAIPSGDVYIVSGRKLWTSNAHRADMMFALLRIEVPENRRLKGLSFLLIDMKSRGVSVRPVITIDGQHVVNEVTLDSVRVPFANLIGEQGKGWEYARFLLANERTQAAGVPIIQKQLSFLKSVMESEAQSGIRLTADMAFRTRFAQMEAELRALRVMELRLLNASAEDSTVHKLAPMLKLRGSELKQRVSELTVEALGERALESPACVSTPLVIRDGEIPHEAVKRSTSTYLYLRSATIVGGTSEIQRNIIASVALGL